MSAALALLPEAPEADDYESTSGERLSVRHTVEQLVQLYEESAATIRSCFAQLADTEARLNAVLRLDDLGSIRIGTRDWHQESYTDAEKAVASLRLTVWASIVERLEIRRFLSVRRAKELTAMLDGKSEESFPEITVANVLAFARGFSGQTAAMLAEAVEEVFDWLRPPRSEYKRNSEYEVPRRVVLRFMVDGSWPNGFRVNYSEHASARLTALQNVFSSLDGQGSIAKTYHGALYDAINASGREGRGETPYFAFRCFKNGNLHLEFRRADLLAKFNAIAGGKRLRP